VVDMFVVDMFVVDMFVVDMFVVNMFVVDMFVVDMFVVNMFVVNMFVVMEQMMLFVDHSLDLYNVVGIDNSIDYRMGYHNRRCNMGLVDTGFVV